jgi:large subunit ribosomal protein L18e
MVKSKTLISKQLEKKTNSELAETIFLAKKNPAWLEMASILSGPRRKRTSLNLKEIGENADNSKIILIPGKVLSQGEIGKKIKVVALNFSEMAKEKLLKAGCEVKTILEEIKSNPEFKDIKILK